MVCPVVLLTPGFVEKTIVFLPMQDQTDAHSIGVQNNWNMKIAYYVTKIVTKRWRIGDS
jgi:hypothetical protein